MCVTPYLGLLFEGVREHQDLVGTYFHAYPKRALSLSLSLT